MSWTLETTGHWARRAKSGPSFRVVGCSSSLVRVGARPGLGLGRKRGEKRRFGSPDGLFAAGAGRDEDGRSADRVFERANVTLGGGRELLVTRDAGGRGLPARQLFVLGLEARGVLGERGKIRD